MMVRSVISCVCIEERSPGVDGATRGTRHQEPGTRHQGHPRDDPAPWCPMPSAQCVVPGSWFLVPAHPTLPPMTLRIYTRTGDRGDTGLFGGGRVGKDDVRVDAYGEVDELNAVVGVA